MDPSPRDHQSNTWANVYLSDVDRRAYLAPRGQVWSAGSSSIGTTMRSSRVHQTAEIVRDLGDAWSFLVRPISIVRTAANRAEHGDRAVHNHVDLNPTAQNYRGRTPRSRFDRTAIAARSNRDRKVGMGESLPVDQRAIDGRPGPRSWPDRGAIVARSWPDRGQMDGYFGAKLKPN